MQNIFTKKVLGIMIFILVIFISQFVFAATSPDAIATRVMPNPDHFSPLRWYKINIKNQGSPQALKVDGYEAIRDGRTVYVNAANINDKGTTITTDDEIYTNIYLLSFSQDMETASQDIFTQFLSHWKFNTNIPAEQKDKVRKDTKRLADLAEIKLAFNSYQASHGGNFPDLAAGSYIAGKSLSVWPSWQATLGKALGITLPIDPVNKLEACPAGYDAKTCWNQATKDFAGIPNNSRTYIYTYNGVGSYNICALMESGYLTSLSQGACQGSAVGFTVNNCGGGGTIPAGYHKEGDQCVSDTAFCPITGGVGKKQWQTSSNSWGPCLATSCTESANYYLYNNNCVDCNTLAGVSGATAVGFNASGQCKITACVSGYHPSASGLNCEINVAACTTTCTTAPGCKTSLSNGQPSASGVCCGAGEICYECNNTHHWDSSTNTCVLNTTPCTTTCTTAGEPNCQADNPDNSLINSNGNCCGGGICYQCENNYIWDGQSLCKPKTQTVPCTDLPNNAEWWNQGMVLQTWTGTGWDQSTVGSFSDEAGTCKFKCSGTNIWDGESACVPICSTVTCTAIDQCHGIGICDPSTGICSNPLKANESSCNDGVSCTKNDVCTFGECVGSYYDCPAPGECQASNTCNGTGCTASNKANGTACGAFVDGFNEGSCLSGVCDKTCPNTWKKTSTSKCLLRNPVGSDYTTAVQTCVNYGSHLATKVEFDALPCTELDSYMSGRYARTNDIYGTGHRCYIVEPYDNSCSTISTCGSSSRNDPIDGCIMVDCWMQDVRSDTQYACIKD